MTTIAWDGQMLAADRLRVNGRGTKGSFDKLRVAGQYAFGLAGDICDYEPVSRWLRAGAKWGDRPEWSDSSDPGIGLAVHAKTRRVSLLYGVKRVHLVEVPQGPLACGSGSPYALAAMACGKNAIQAVVIAARFDDGTGCETDSWPENVGCRRIELPPMPDIPTFAKFAKGVTYGRKK